MYLEIVLPYVGSLSGLLLLFYIIFPFAFLVPFFQQRRQYVAYVEREAPLRLSEALLIASVVALGFYKTFFKLSDKIWAMQSNLPESVFNPGIRWAMHPSDGAESYALYAGMFLCIGFTIILAVLLQQLRKTLAGYLVVYLVLFFAMVYYYSTIGMTPPVMAKDPPDHLLPLLLTFFAIALYVIYLRSRAIALIVAITAASFVGLFAILPSSPNDLSYILAPALRLLHGFSLKHIYFQYDLFLSLLAALWMKLGLGIETFSYLGDLSFGLFFILCLIITDRFFKTKGLSVVFMTALILVRFYAVAIDNISLFQVTPLRLDLWVILLYTVHRKGAAHWLNGLVLALLMLFHRSLGLVYLVGYLQLLIALFLVDVWAPGAKREFSTKALLSLIIKHLRQARVSLAIIAISLVVCIGVFGGLVAEAAADYRKYGIGMLPISPFSFYWYVPVLLSTLAACLLYRKKVLGDNYFQTGTFIVLIAIGNSLYFLGRSAENNLLHSSAAIVMALFTLFDISIFTALRPLQSPVRGAGLLSKRTILLCLPFVFICLCGYYYSDIIKRKMTLETNNLSQHKFAKPLEIDVKSELPALRTVTHSSDKLFMLDFDQDFYYYYYGHYTPLGYYNPCLTWVFKKDMFGYIQGLLNDGYYVVYRTNDSLKYYEFVKELDYKHVNRSRNMVSLSK